MERTHLISTLRLAQDELADLFPQISINALDHLLTNESMEHDLRRFEDFLIAAGVAEHHGLESLLVDIVIEAERPLPVQALLDDALPEGREGLAELGFLVQQ